MTLPDAGRLLSPALLLMRLMVGAIFLTSGWSHTTKTKERAKSIEMSGTPGTTSAVVHESESRLIAPYQVSAERK